MKVNLFLILSVLLFNRQFSQNKFNYPVADKQTVEDDYFGKKVKDPYRWLEDDRSAKTEAWVKQENQVTEKYLSTIGVRDSIRKRLTDLWNYNKQYAPFKKGPFYFCFKNNGLQNQNVLYIKKTIKDAGEVLLDPNQLSKEGTVSLSNVAVSNNGKTLAYGISKAGSDWVEIHFKDIATKKDLPDVINWVKFSDLSWRGNGIYYSRYDAPTESALSQSNQFHKVYYHRLNTTQQQDVLAFDDKNNADYNFGASVTDDENYLIVTVSKSTSGKKVLIKDLIDPNSKFVTVCDHFDFENQVIDNIGNTFYMLTNNKAPKYKLVSFTLNTPEESNHKTVLPQSDDLMEGVRFCNNKIVVNYLHDVSSKLLCYQLDGRFDKEIRLPGLCRLTAFNSDKKFDFAFYSLAQFTAPEQTFYLEAKTWESALYFKPDCKFDSEKFITEQIFFPSFDGTKVPMFITRKKDLVLTKETPCFVYGYGGFNISLAPEFKIDRAVFLEAGGIYCVPSIRGGGEYGEDWHQAGIKCNKQTVFNDFISACDYLVAKKMTSYKKIAIHGRSNGGLLIGALMTQRPDICRVALPTVGVLDMLRFHMFTIGRAWTFDYGSSEQENEFLCLYKYSPLHNVKSTKYPATMILTGDHDDRVVPAHSFKFAATLQDKNKGDNPVLIRIDVNAGHGAGKPTSKQIEEFTDMWAFTFYNLEMKF